MKSTKKVNKKLYYWDGQNFGDELNKFLFEDVFAVKFSYCNTIWSADYTAIGSVLQHVCVKSRKKKSEYIKKLLTGRVKFSRLAVLGSGFLQWPNENTAKFLRKMDFRIVRGKLTEGYLKNQGLLKDTVLLGDLGLLCSYMVDETPKKYALGIIPHLEDLSSPAFYDIKKKYGKNCIFINVQDDVRVVLKQIAECKAIAGSAMHGLIAADSLKIPNLWLENTLKREAKGKESRKFKFKDYYSVYGIDEIEPLNVLDFLDSNLDVIEQNYKVKEELVTEKQKELYEYCKIYFENL